MKRLESLLLISIIISMVGCGIVDPNEDLSIDTEQDIHFDNNEPSPEVDVNPIVGPMDELQRPGDWEEHPILARPVKMDITA
jgi:hypothetical protein